MAELILRNVEEELVRELELLSARNGRSAEEEHHLILRRALSSEHTGQSLKEILSEMPDVGEDRDLERIQCAHVSHGRYS